MSQSRTLLGSFAALLMDGRAHLDADVTCERSYTLDVGSRSKKKNKTITERYLVFVGVWMGRGLNGGDASTPSTTARRCGKTGPHFGCEIRKVPTAVNLACVRAQEQEAQSSCASTIATQCHL